MDKDTELQDSPELDEVLDQETETKAPEESETERKNRQLFERAKKAETAKKELEVEIQRLKGERTEDDPVLVDAEIRALKKQLTEMQQKSELDQVLGQYPVLKDKLDEFDSYREENAGMSLTTAAKAFLAEKDLLGGAGTTRKGLEPARGGKKTPPAASGMTSEDAKKLRENNFREYTRLVNEGKLVIKD